MLDENSGKTPEIAKRAAMRATLRGTQGVLCIEVLGYEYADAVDGPDADWLVMRLDVKEPGRHVAFKGAALLADELAHWGARTEAFGRESRVFGFVEPNLSFGWSCRAADGSRFAHVEVFSEARDGHARVDVALRVTDAQLRAFGRGLQRLACLFPPRSTLMASRVS